VRWQPGGRLPAEDEEPVFQLCPVFYRNRPTRPVVPPAFPSLLALAGHPKLGFAFASQLHRSRRVAPGKDAESVNLQEQEQLVRSHYNRISDKWGDLYKDEVTFANYNFIVRKRHVMSLFDKVGGHYLDAGCGTGDFIPDLLDRSGSVTALDFAEDMIEQSRTRMARRHLDQQVSFAVGDVTNLEYDDNSFDAIIGVGLIEYLTDYRAALKEFHRVLRPGGIVIVTVPSIVSPFMAYETLVPKCKGVVKKALSAAGLREPERAYFQRHFVPWALDRDLRRIGYRKKDFSFCTYGFSSSKRLESFSLGLTRRLDGFGHSPLGVLATNYIVKAEKPSA
jgi:ubiquinone/menaquinone biosynthesis C-methylase UbiE